MHLFTDYIQPLTVWLYDHPYWALFITFIVAFSESLAIVGSIIPGSVTMTAIGILAGSGVMRIDLTLVIAALGAIAGDSASYALGYHYSHRLIHLWPFKNYPQWILYGEEYFKKHGGVSVLIGRFVGPMRSIIPVIAGMMRMNQWQFLLANTVSAGLWSILYIMPGVFIGAAGSELSAESATRLFILILAALIIIWLSGLGIKWLFVHTQQFLRYRLNLYWEKRRKSPVWGQYARFLTPPGETHYYPTAALSLLFFTLLFISVIITLMVVQVDWLFKFDEPLYLFFQSFRTQAFDEFFVFTHLIVSPIPLLGLILTVIGYAFYHRDWRLLRYWLSLIATTSLVIYTLHLNIDLAKPLGFLKHRAAPSYPEMSLTLATALFGFLVLYMNAHYRKLSSVLLRILIVLLISLVGIATIYLGDNWISSLIASYFIGFTLCILHWIFYRRTGQTHQRSEVPIFLVTLTLILLTFVAYPIYFKKNLLAHHPHPAQYLITEPTWWNQKKPLLPLFSTNRIGQATGILNIQYAGSINTLKFTLEAHGWKRQRDSFFYSLLMRAGGKNTAEEMPLTAQLYLNKKPNLIMTYQLKKEKAMLVLRLWRSNYHLHHYHQTIWLGSVNYPLPFKQLSTHPMSISGKQPYHYVMDALPSFIFKKLVLPQKYLSKLPHKNAPVLLIIKTPPDNITSN